MALTAQNVESGILLARDARERDTAIVVVHRDCLLLHHKGDGLRGDVAEEVGDKAGVYTKAVRFVVSSVGLQHFHGGLHHVFAVEGCHTEVGAAHLEEEVVENSDGRLGWDGLRKSLN